MRLYGEEALTWCEKNGRVPWVWDAFLKTYLVAESELVAIDTLRWARHSTNADTPYVLTLNGAPHRAVMIDVPTDRQIHSSQATTKCPCGIGECAGPSDGAYHACGGPREACGARGCPECRPPRSGWPTLSPAIQSHPLTLLDVHARTRRTVASQCEGDDHKRHIEIAKACEAAAGWLRDDGEKRNAWGLTSAEKIAVLEVERATAEKERDEAEKKYKNASAECDDLVRLIDETRKAAGASDEETLPEAVRRLADYHKQWIRATGCTSPLAIGDALREIGALVGKAPTEGIPDAIERLKGELEAARESRKPLQHTLGEIADLTGKGPQEAYIDAVKRLLEIHRARGRELDQALSDRDEFRAQRDSFERDLSRLLDDREHAEDVVTKIALALGCEKEWTNAHSHYACAVERAAETHRMVSNLRSERDNNKRQADTFRTLGKAAEAALTEIRRIASALDEHATHDQYRRICSLADEGLGKSGVPHFDHEWIVENAFVRGRTDTMWTGHRGHLELKPKMGAWIVHIEDLDAKIRSGPYTAEQIAAAWEPIGNVTIEPPPPPIPEWVREGAEVEGASPAHVGQIGILRQSTAGRWEVLVNGECYGWWHAHNVASAWRPRSVPAVSQASITAIKHAILHELRSSGELGLWGDEIGERVKSPIVHSAIAELCDEGRIRKSDPGPFVMTAAQREVDDAPSQITAVARRLGEDCEYMRREIAGFKESLIVADKSVRHELRRAEQCLECIVSVAREAGVLRPGMTASEARGAIGAKLRELVTRILDLERSTEERVLAHQKELQALREGLAAEFELRAVALRRDKTQYADAKSLGLDAAARLARSALPHLGGIPNGITGKYADTIAPHPIE